MMSTDCKIQQTAANGNGGSKNMSSNENNLLSHTVIVGLAIQLVSTLSYPVSVAQSVTLFTRSRSHIHGVLQSQICPFQEARGHRARYTAVNECTQTRGPWKPTSRTMRSQLSRFRVRSPCMLTKGVHPTGLLLLNLNSVDAAIYITVNSASY